MARSTLSTSRLFSILGRELSEEELRETLFRTKVEVGRPAQGAVDVEVNADRLDLLDEGGLAWELEGALGKAHGLPYEAERAPLPSVEARVNASVSPLRPEISLAAVVAPQGRPLDDGLIEELVRFQEILHLSLGRDRVAASLGLYPLERLKPPIHYAMEPVGQVRFVPLGSSQEVGGAEFFAAHPMASRYGELGRRDDLILTLRDEARSVLSLPPVLNSVGAGEVRPGDSKVLIESTGTREARAREMVGYMLVPFLARGWKVHPVPVHRPDSSNDGRRVVDARPMKAAVSAVNALLGLRTTAAEVEKALLARRLGTRRDPDGLVALVPPWRSDLLGSVDLGEEVAIARGYGSFQPILPPSPSMGRRLPERRLREQVGRVLLGLGFQELHTSVLLSPASAERFSAAGEALALRNPISQEYSRVRPVLRASLFDVLARNTGSGYPQRIFDIGSVVVRDAQADTGTRTEVHLALAEAGEGAGFARVAGVGERLFEVLGMSAPREPSEAPGSIAGRVARIRIAGATVALLGEAHPRVLSELKVPVPVGWLEVDLSAVERLRGLSS